MILVPVKGPTRQVHLSTAREAALVELARRHGVAVKTPDGSRAKPGWRALLCAIADGKIVTALPAAVPCRAAGETDAEKTTDADGIPTHSKA